MSKRPQVRQAQPKRQGRSLPRQQPLPVIIGNETGLHGIPGVWPCFRGVFTGHSVLVPHLDDASSLHNMGCFGKPFTSKFNTSAPSIFRRRQYNLRKNWESQVKTTTNESKPESDSSVYETSDEEDEDIQVDTVRTNQKRVWQSTSDDDEDDDDTTSGSDIEDYNLRCWYDTNSIWGTENSQKVVSKKYKFVDNKCLNKKAKLTNKEDLSQKNKHQNKGISSDDEITIISDSDNSIKAKTSPSPDILLIPNEKENKNPNFDEILITDQRKNDEGDENDKGTSQKDAKSLKNSHIVSPLEHPKEDLEVINLDESSCKELGNSTETIEVESPEKNLTEINEKEEMVIDITTPDKETVSNKDQINRISSNNCKSLTLECEEDESKEQQTTESNPSDIDQTKVKEALDEETVTGVCEISSGSTSTNEITINAPENTKPDIDSTEKNNFTKELTSKLAPSIQNTEDAMSDSSEFDFHLHLSQSEDEMTSNLEPEPSKEMLPSCSSVKSQSNDNATEVIQITSADPIPVDITDTRVADEDGGLVSKNENDNSEKVTKAQESPDETENKLLGTEQSINVPENEKQSSEKEKKTLDVLENKNETLEKERKVKTSSTELENVNQSLESKEKAQQSLEGTECNEQSSDKSKKEALAKVQVSTSIPVIVTCDVSMDEEEGSSSSDMDLLNMPITESGDYEAPEDTTMYEQERDIVISDSDCEGGKEELVKKWCPSFVKCTWKACDEAVTLNLEETFFLSWALGCLNVMAPQSLLLQLLPPLHQATNFQPSQAVSVIKKTSSENNHVSVISSPTKEDNSGTKPDVRPSPSPVISSVIQSSRQVDVLDDDDDDICVVPNVDSRSSSPQNDCTNISPKKSEDIIMLDLESSENQDKAQIAAHSTTSNDEIITLDQEREVNQSGNDDPEVQIVSQGQSTSKVDPQEGKMDLEGAKTSSGVLGSKPDTSSPQPGPSGLQNLQKIAQVYGLDDEGNGDVILLPSVLWGLSCRQPNFPSRYVVYHHFRSLGWVVKSGIKFGGDFLLYQYGPSYNHASYVVMVNRAVSATCWQKVMTTNRIAEVTKKGVLMCNVEWPGGLESFELLSKVNIRVRSISRPKLSREAARTSSNLQESSGDETDSDVSD